MRETPGPAETSAGAAITPGKIFIKTPKPTIAPPRPGLPENQASDPQNAISVGARSNRAIGIGPCAARNNVYQTSRPTTTSGPFLPRPTWRINSQTIAASQSSISAPNAM